MTTSDLLKQGMAVLKAEVAARSEAYTTVRRRNGRQCSGSCKRGRAVLLCRTLLVAALCLLLVSATPSGLSASTLDAPPPTVATISPTEAYNYQATAITIAGTGFFTVTGTSLIVPTIYLGNVSLTDVTFVSSTTLTATVPADLPGGIYTLTVTNPDSQSASLANAFTVLLSGDGSLSVWQTTSSMTMLRTGFAVVSVGSYIYALGGWPGSVERAEINPDGSLDPWQATTSMTGEWYDFAAVAASGYIYALGGTGGDGNNVTRAAINADGSLGPWQAATSMTTGRRFPAAVVVGRYLYALGGYDNLPGSAKNSVERAMINADGSLGPWQAVTPMTEARSTHAAVVVGNYIYVMGGDGMSSVVRATVNPDGSLGPWEAATSMTASRCDFAAVTARGYIYVLGGRGSWAGTAPRYDSVERAKVNLNGSLGPWEAVASMSTPRYEHAAVGAGGYVYAVGGRDEFNTRLSSVERAEIVDGMLPTGYRVSINDGALFTNEVTVTLTIGLEPETAQMQVSNDGGFAGAEWEPYASSKVWQITQYGSYVIPRVVYVRYKEHSGNVSATYQDDIILDVNAPNGSVEVTPGVSGSSLRKAGTETAAMHPVTIRATDDYPYTVYLPFVARDLCILPTGPANITLHLEAEDDVSGVADMMISHLPNCHCGRWELYATTKEWYAPEGATMIYVKFRDNAGNISEVVTDTINW